MKKTLIITLILAMVITASLTVMAQETKVLKLSHLNPQQPKEVATAAMAEVFKSMVESGTSGSITVEVYPNGVLGNERESMEQVQSGVTHSYIASGGGMATFYPMFSIVNIPFSITNYSVAYEVYDGEFGQKMAADIEEKTGFKVLGFGESGGFFQLSNSERPIRTPADMEGLKFRTMTIPIHMEFMRSLGASPTPIAWAELYKGLQTGVVDGQHNPIPIIKIGKLEEVQKYLTLTNHMYTPYVWVLNSDFYASLTPEEQVIVDEAARVANLAGRGVNRLIEASEAGLPYLQKEMEVYKPTAEEMQMFKDASIPASMDFIEEEYGKEGSKFAQEYLDAIEAAQDKFGM
ncbi:MULTISPECIES: DctP family TRAP transporter solute-binding subunit [Halanaerobium]|uniref:Tripartite ATP-independent transporter DctP family solute receptor n=1 Tax=Halanaerobium saccharolyticum TaxID=43595 RepID=A0A4R6SIZ6_9FIRM|nr:MULTISPECIES: DctP family TRAP transporter solute-binding subunit [Halanaerobium]PUU91748.1 MAG: TRAP dicarboxylate transporter subunit DctP [Halanaerobium sp.]TDQ01653.1 tripartite ATP-independent transporter DctP family solute receptor [Halanaerobium saccharolyticum]